MAKKTVLKLLLSKFGILSIEMKSAIEKDQAIIKDVDADSIDYVDRTDENDMRTIEINEMNGKQEFTESEEVTEPETTMVVKKEEPAQKPKPPAKKSAQKKTTKPPAKKPKKQNNGKGGQGTLEMKSE